MNKRNINPSFHPVSTVDDPEPNVEGKLAGYCGLCRMMIIVGEERCSRCFGVEVVKDSPPPKFGMYSRGFTRSTGGNPRAIATV